MLNVRKSVFLLSAIGLIFSAAVNCTSTEPLHDETDVGEPTAAAKALDPSSSDRAIPESLNGLTLHCSGETLRFDENVVHIDNELASYSYDKGLLIIKNTETSLETTFQLEWHATEVLLTGLDDETYERCHAKEEKSTPGGEISK
jgi:hypothetical protein